MSLQKFATDLCEPNHQHALGMKGKMHRHKSTNHCGKQKELGTEAQKQEARKWDSQKKR
jgi:hypothetical protein